MSLPKISLITVVYNGAEHLEECLQSVFRQNYPALEHIVIDGASTDGTVDIIKKYEDRFAYWVSEPDGGIYPAMNKGLAKVSGELVGILNADDYHQEGTLKAVAKAWQDSEHADLIYGNLNKLRQFGERSYFRAERPDLSRIEETMSILHPATFVSKATYDKIGGFDEQYRLSADYDFVLRAHLAGCRFHYLDRSLTVFRIGGATSMDCRTYEEGYAILKTHNTGHQDAMKALIEVCKRKQKRQKNIHTLARMLGLRGVLESRIEAKWKQG